MGMVKSAMGIGGLLCMGIGDTIRVTLTADPVEEIYAAKKILKAAGLRKEGVNLISCPTCGRTRIDLIPMTEEVERRLADCEKNITVAVMGCAVNGPGEAREADYGVAGGREGHILFNALLEIAAGKIRLGGIHAGQRYRKVQLVHREQKTGHQRQREDQFIFFIIFNINILFF